MLFPDNVSMMMFWKYFFCDYYILNLRQNKQVNYRTYNLVNSYSLNLQHEESSGIPTFQQIFKTIGMLSKLIY